MNQCKQLHHSIRKRHHFTISEDYNLRQGLLFSSRRSGSYTLYVKQCSLMGDQHAARALAYCAKDQCSEPTWNQWLEARLLSTLQQRGTRAIKAARKGAGHPTSEDRWPRTSVLSIRYSPKYGRIWESPVQYQKRRPVCVVNISSPQMGIAINIHLLTQYQEICKQSGATTILIQFSILCLNGHSSGTTCGQLK